MKTQHLIQWYKLWLFLSFYFSEFLQCLGRMHTQKTRTFIEETEEIRIETKQDVDLAPMLLEMLHVF